MTAEHICLVDEYYAGGAEGAEGAGDAGGAGGAGGGPMGGPSMRLIVSARIDDIAEVKMEDDVNKFAIVVQRKKTGLFKGTKSSTWRLLAVDRRAKDKLMAELRNSQQSL